MSKKSFRALAFQEKRADFSTRINANGRAAILPARAQELEIVKTDLRSTLTSLFEQRAKLTQQRNKHPQGSEEWLRIDQTLNRVRGNLGHIEKTLKEVKSLHHAIIFEFVAGLFLSEHALSVIRKSVAELKGLPPKQSNA